MPCQQKKGSVWPARLFSSNKYLISWAMICRTKGSLPLGSKAWARDQTREDGQKRASRFRYRGSDWRCTAGKAEEDIDGGSYWPDRRLSGSRYTQQVYSQHGYIQQDKEFLFGVIIIPNHYSDGVLSNRLNSGKVGKTDIRTRTENSVAEFRKGG